MKRTWNMNPAARFGRRLGFTAMLVALVAVVGCQKDADNEQAKVNDKKKSPNKVERIKAVVDPLPPTKGDPNGKEKTDPDPRPNPRPGPDPGFKANLDLEHIPADAIGFVAVKVGALWQSPPLKEMRSKVPPDALAPLQNHEKTLGLKIEDIHRVTAVVLGLPTNKPTEPPLAVIIATRRAVPRKKLLAAYAPKAKEMKAGNVSYFPMKNGFGVHFASRFITIIAKPEDLAKVAPAKKGPGKLTADIEDAKKHMIVAAVDPKPLMTAYGNEIPPQLAATKTVGLASLTIDLNQKVLANLRLNFPKQDQAKNALAALNAYKKLAETLVAKAPLPFDDLEQQRNARAKLSGFVKGLTLRQRGAELVVSLATDSADLAILPQLVYGAPKPIVKLEGADQVVHNLKQIALAAHYYELRHGCLPPAAIYKDGKAMLSWRVLLLPYLDQQALFDEFKLDEPWDSPHNKKLIDKMPEIYALPDQAEKGLTYLRAFSGSGAFMEGEEGVKFSGIADGPANTAFVVETAQPVAWTKPLDLPYDAGKPLPRLGKLNPGSFIMLFVDGSVKGIPLTEEKQIRAFITRAGKEK